MTLHKSVKPLAIITGATSEIGKHIALALAEKKVNLVLTARRKDHLQKVKDQLAVFPVSVFVKPMDLMHDDEIKDFAASISSETGGVDYLIHNAGMIAIRRFEEYTIDEIDEQLQINFRAPVILTNKLLPLIRENRGQIVFVNSSIVIRARPNFSLYYTAKNALKAFAESIREENKHFGVRVLSVFPGKTASEMQFRLHQELKEIYQPELLKQPEDVAIAIVNALMLPITCGITDMYMMATGTGLEKK